GRLERGGGGRVQAPDDRDVRGTIPPPLCLGAALGRRHHRPAQIARGAGAQPLRRAQRADRGDALRRLPDVTMARKPGRFVPYARGYAKPNAFRRVGPVPWGLPPRRPRRTRRLADPRTYLGAVIVLAALGLVVLPVAADAVIAVTRPAAAAEGTCRIYQVIDGDTVRMVCPGRGNTSARLTGFDAPELFSPACASEFAAAVTAKWALRLKLWQAEKVTLVRG